MWTGSRLAASGRRPAPSRRSRSAWGTPGSSAGLELAKRAQVSDPRNPQVHWCAAQLHILAGSRRDAIEAVERGLRAAPDNFILLRMRRRLGVRQPTPLPFLARNHKLNVRLGRWMHRLRGNAA